MPGEEMEITTDFGHSGFGEEIDIDLDFAAGQNDGDLELADFDQTEDIENFNVDTRDELMAEGDDASFGMIDADDIEQNEVAATANDIEIDLGDPGDNSWEQDVFHGDAFANLDEIDYVEENAIGNNDVSGTSVVNVDYIEASAANAQPAVEFTEEQPLDLSNEPTAQDLTELQAAAQVSSHENLQSSPRGSPKDRPTEDGPTDTQRLSNVDEAPELEDDEYNRAIGNEDQASIPATSAHSPSEEQPTEQLVEQEQQPEEGHTSEFPNGQSDENETAVAPGDEDSSKADDYIFSVAARYNMYVVYHDVVYRLFAESEDDDPNGYFLSDMSALQFTLGDFMSSLRSVIEEEVSPLDELVVLIDGIGIEVAESSKPELLDGYTLGDILSLYDKLAQNDEEESSTDIFFHLMFTPDCLKRLMALNESAIAGRGLHEVGVFKEHDQEQYLEGENRDDEYATDEDQADEDQADEDQADEDQADEDQASEEKASEDQAGQDQIGEDQTGENQAGEDQAEEFQADEFESRASSQSPHEPEEHDSEGDGGDNANKIENGTRTKSPSLYTSVAEAETTDLVESLEETREQNEQKTDSATNENVVEEADDGLIDYSDDDLDVSQQQGKTTKFPSPDPYPCDGTLLCDCDDCFNRVMGLDEKRSVIAPTAMEVSSRQPNHSPRNAEQPVASLSRQESLFSRFQSLNLRSSTNLYVPEDQRANTSLEDGVQETTKESNDVATSETSASNQHASPFNGLTGTAVSVATSATATLTGDDKDEIDYSDDEDELNRNPSVDGRPNDGISHNGPVETPRTDLHIEDEITWESDNEDGNDDPPTAPQDVVQVSPSGKRPRSDSDLSESETGPIGVKRRRSS
ncbi:hypothetical protein GGR53DRAFT_469736 [Hypoxylon sp. FL1150]|nr:hypothetical protein GGR53DRAFT_469736 [Hypoxylon sp. FL1150]